MSSLPHLLSRAAAAHPERGFYFLRGESIDERLTYRQLEGAAFRVARQLGEAGIQAGERALLVYDSGLDFVAAFWGCLFAGVVPVPAPPPHPSRPKRTLPRLSAISADCSARVALTHQKVQGLPPELARGLIFTDQTAIEPGGPVPERPGLAVLQYTSGSTRQPRGVMLTHANLLHNLDMLADFHGRHEPLRMVHWLPLFHDMGLIRGMLSPVHMAGDCLMMDAMEFVQRPRRWLKAMSDFRATVTGAPDFGYALVNRKVAPTDVQDLDLSSLRVAFCTAEPIRASTLREFAQLLAPCDLTPGALKPSFGLAEATVMVCAEMGQAFRTHLVSRRALSGNTISPPEDEADTVEQVSCGRPLGGQELLVVDAARRLCPSHTVGEVWLRGPSVSCGYWNRQDDPTFRARLAGQESPSYLATGDLGWLDANGALTICGRLKDLIIVRGQNFYPQDIEMAVQDAVPEVRPGNLVAFAREDGGIVLVAEAESPSTNVAQAVWAAAGEELGLSLVEVLLLSPGELPKTASGKVQRRLTAAAHAGGDLQPQVHWVAPAKAV